MRQALFSLDQLFLVHLLVEQTVPYLMRACSSAKVLRKAACSSEDKWTIHLHHPHADARVPSCAYQFLPFLHYFLFPPQLPRLTQPQVLLRRKTTSVKENLIKVEPHKTLNALYKNLPFLHNPSFLWKEGEMLVLLEKRESKLKGVASSPFCAAFPILHDHPMLWFPL